MAYGDRSVDVFMRKVRRKLDAVSPRWEYIHTHFGVGYRFDPELRDGMQPADQPRPGELDQALERITAGLPK